MPRLYRGSSGGVVMGRTTLKENGNEHLERRICSGADERSGARNLHWASRHLDCGRGGTGRGTGESREKWSDRVKLLASRRKSRNLGIAKSLTLNINDEKQTRVISHGM